MAAVQFILSIKFHLYPPIFRHEATAKEVFDGINGHTLLAADDGFYGH